jgi:hypothetical protein
MKKYICLVALCSIAPIAVAQNIQTEKIGFHQTLYPKKALPPNVNTYTATIVTPYLKDDSTFRKMAEDKYQQDLKNYPNTVKEAEKHYQEVTLAQYNLDSKDAREKYDKETAEFNKMSTLERLALADKKPVLTLPQKPPYYAPPMPQVESINTSDVIIFEPETLAKNYIKLDGFGQGNALQINIDFKGFEYKDPVAEIVDKENFNPVTKEKFITKQTQYVTRYRHPATLEVKMGNEVIIPKAVFGETANLISKVSDTKPTRIYIERQIVESTLQDIGTYLNSLYGYPKIYRNGLLYYVKNKGGEYDDLEKAKDFAKSGYKNYEVNQDEAIKDIQSAIEIWEKAITEANYEDSKARIDEKVGTVVLKNLIFAAIVTNDFNKAAKYIAEFKKLRLSYDDKQYIAQQEKSYDEMKSRFKG